jgi:signal transduction histidine kinase
MTTNSPSDATTSSSGRSDKTATDCAPTATTARRPTRFGRLGLGARLFAAMGLVVAAGAGTLLVVALLIAPAIFLTHLRRAGTPELTPSVQTHVERAFTQATLLALGIGTLAAVAAAALVTWLVARRLAAPVTDLATATTRLADGDYATTVPDPRLGPEFTALTAAMNQLSGRLSSSEDTRRRLLADLGHELRTPLASLEATIEAITDGVLPVDQTSLTTLTEQASRLHRLVADLESVSRAEERQLVLHPAPADLAHLAERAVTVVLPRYQARGIHLMVHAPHLGPTVSADADRLLEALMNLLDNALRHTPTGGHVTLTVDTTTPTPQQAALARLTITDTGTGFTPEQAPHLFDRFYRTDPTPAGDHDPSTSSPVVGNSAGRRGTGIGLTITRAIIEAHHGSIEAHSDGPGHGARFTLTLPPLAAKHRPSRPGLT